MNQDKTVAKTIDMLHSLPTAYHLKHNKKHTNKQKRTIRRAFNKIQPEFTSKVNQAVSDLVRYGSSSI